MDNNIDDLMYGADGDVVEDTFGEEDNTCPFPDGEFIIKSFHDNNLSLDLVEDASGGFIHCHNYIARDNQTWILGYDEEKEGYKIKSKQNPELLLSWNSTDTSKNIILKEYTGSSGNNQYWRIESTEDGYFELRNLENLDLMITMQNKSSKLGGKEVIVDTAKSTSDKENCQKWIINFFCPQSISDGDYHIVNCNLTEMVIDLRNESDSLVRAHSYLGSDNQEWTFSFDKEKEAYKIKSVLNPQLLLTWKTSDAAKEMILQGSTESGSKNQYWRLDRTSDGSYKLRSLEDLSKVLSVSAVTGSNDGVNLLVHEDNSDLHLKWTIKRVSHQTISDGEYRIFNHTVPDVVVDLINEEGSLVRGCSYSGKDNQKWTIVYDGDKKAYKIKSAVNNLLLSWNSSASKEATLRGCAESGSRHQYWRIEQTNVGSYKLRNLENAKLLAVIEKELTLSDNKENDVNKNWDLKKIGNANIIPNGKYKIATNLSCKNVIDTTQESVLAVIDNKNLASSEWLVTFDLIKNAYKIISSKDTNLGWVYQSNDCSVKVDNVLDADNLGNYWSIEYNILKGRYLIRSLSQPSIAVSYSDDKLVITSTAIYSDNQMFHFVQN